MNAMPMTPPTSWRMRKAVAAAWFWEALMADAE